MLSKLEPRAALSRLAIPLSIVAFLFALGGGSALAATTYAALCDGVNLRSNAGTSYAIKASVQTGTQVAVVATVSGGSWSTSCAGKSATGSSWYRISAVNGTSASTLYGVTYVYGATSLFKAVVSGTPTPTPSSSPTPPPGATPLGDTVTFYGRGYGHGVGMSQAGAQGRAAAGQDYQTILAHYYQGTTLGTTSATQVRVLLLSGFSVSSSIPLKLYGRGGTWKIANVAITFPADALMRVIPTVSGTVVSWKVVVTASDGTSLYSAATTGNLLMQPASSTTTLQLYSKPTSYDRFRGNLRIRVSTATPTTSVVNEVGLEDYLKGVVPAEMSSASLAAALRAQAIASRSYAVRRLHPTTGTYDLYDDTRSQVYHGVLAERAATNTAVMGTAGVVLKYGSSVANALYHACGGGATESNQNVWNAANGAITSSPVPYLQGSMDRAPDGTAYDKASSYATWHTATYTLAQVQAFFAADSRTNVGTLVALDLTHRGVGERLISVTLVGADGTMKTVSGGVFVSVFNAHRPSSDAPMRDTLVDLAPIP